MFCFISMVANDAQATNWHLLFNRLIEIIYIFFCYFEMSSLWNVFNHIIIRMRVIECEENFFFFFLASTRAMRSDKKKWVVLLKTT